MSHILGKYYEYYTIMQKAVYFCFLPASMKYVGWVFSVQDQAQYSILFIMSVSPHYSSSKSKLKSLVSQ